MKYIVFGSLGSSLSATPGSCCFIHYLVACLLLLVSFGVNGQDVPSDSATFAEDTVYARGRVFAAATPVMKSRERYPHFEKTSFLAGINTIPGVRMEERSPGSYRLSMRGSALRSPFGVRNIRIYWNDIPLTDPGGNTYLNQLAFNNISEMTIVKSTATANYGSGTGGQLLISNLPAKQKDVSLELVGGSFGLKTLLASATFIGKNIRSKVSYAHNEADGYREQSAMMRDNFSWVTDVKLSAKQQLVTSVLFTDMDYQAPGGLTRSEFEINPRLSRPAAGAFPSAVDAKAAIFQKNITAGITYKHKLNSFFSNNTTVYGAYNRIENSAIRNYEMRNEPHWGGRSAFKMYKTFDNGSSLDWQTGGELQSGNFNVKVLSNKAGIADTVQTNDDVNTVLYNVFSQAAFSTHNQWVFEAGLSFNKSRVAFRRLSDEPVIDQPFSFSNEVVPRFGVLKRLRGGYSFSALVSKGFSAPTIAELLPSTGIINTTLQAEKGWNYELVLRARPVYGLDIDASLFTFELRDALVQRRDEAGADYFTNAGGTRQNGVEVNASYKYIRDGDGIFEDGKLTAGYAYSYFKYIDFIKDNTDFTGKKLPGVPRNTLSLLADVYFKNKFYLISSYYAASSIFLNDANTAAAKPYHLLTAKVGYMIAIKKTILNIYAGADNLLNQTYSLGNDINAAAGRYYNAAPGRNYYAGAAVSLKK